MNCYSLSIYTEGDEIILSQWEAEQPIATIKIAPEQVDLVIAWLKQARKEAMTPKKSP
jgi:hypothetical protein